MVNLKSLIQALALGGKKPDTLSEILRLEELAADMRREIADSEAEIREISARRQELLLDDADDQLAEDEARAGTLRRNVERAELGRQRIGEELVEAKKAHRAARIAVHRADRDDIVRRLTAAMQAAVEVNREAMAWHDRVCSELGHHTINSEFSGAIAYPFLAGDFIEPFKANLAQMAGPPALAPRAAPKPKPAKRVVAAPAPAPRPVRPARAALPEQVPSGQVRVTVLRPGYETPSGEQLNTGDMADLPRDIGHAAAEAGAVEFVSQEAAA